MAQPRVIHDFFGFPQALFDFDYPAPGAPEVAEEIAAVVRPDFIALDTDSWGLDHGTWSVLAHMFPKADIPVVQLSIHAGEDIGYHVELGKRLAPLRDSGILIIASGNVVHNLRRLDRQLSDRAFDWADDFDQQVKVIMTQRPDELSTIADHPAYSLAVPTPEHFLPLAYVAGLAAADAHPAKVLVDGGVMGALTMTGYVLGHDPVVAPASGDGTRSMSMPSAIPPEHTNT